MMDNSIWCQRIDENGPFDKKKGKNVTIKKESKQKNLIKDDKNHTYCLFNGNTPKEINAIFITYTFFF